MDNVHHYFVRKKNNILHDGEKKLVSYDIFRSFVKQLCDPFPKQKIKYSWFYFNLS